MNNLNKAYIAIDLHHANSMIGFTNKEGKLLGLRQVKTSGQNLIHSITRIPTVHREFCSRRIYV